MIIITKSKVKKIILCLLWAGVMLAFILYCGKQIKKEANTIETSSKLSKYEILVDVEESKLYLFENKELIKTYSCSGGKWSTPSPIGTWTVIQKETWGEGFGRKVDGLKCTLGKIWNTRNIRPIFSGLGKLTRMYKNE